MNRKITTYKRPSLTDLARTAGSYKMLEALIEVIGRSTCSRATAREFFRVATERKQWLDGCVCGHSEIAHGATCSVCTCQKFNSRGEAGDAQILSKAKKDQQ